MIHDPFLLTPYHPDALLERAEELERIAQSLRRIAKGEWADPVNAHLEDWTYDTRHVRALFGTRTASGKLCRSAPLLVVDEDGGRALCMSRTWSLGHKRTGDAA